ncbi:MAG TPA: hypothetical protein VMX38_17815 [Verrucomicrobiae bacterium]|jgi:hypothetical protein|nr:hypothetical protein [Verrucomicrobiae bacterium]
MPNRLATIVFLALASFASAQSNTQAAPAVDSHSVPSLDAGIGSCTADFLITGTDSKPVYNAKVKVHIAYGTWSLHKLDLEVDTNVDGKARFTGLPDRIKRGLFFRASQDDRTGEAFDDPSQTCSKQFTIVLRRSDQPSDQSTPPSAQNTPPGPRQN